jgi:hypothetical protein
MLFFFLVNGDCVSTSTNLLALLFSTDMSDDQPKSKIEVEEEKKKKKEEAEANEKKIEYQIHTAVVQYVACCVFLFPCLLLLTPFHLIVLSLVKFAIDGLRTPVRWFC